MARELHPLGERADDERRGDRREGELKRQEGHFGNRHALREGVGGGLVGDAGEERLREAADDRAEAAGAGGEGQRVAVEDPQDRNQAEHREDLRQQRQHVLGANEAAIEQGETRDRHEDDQDGGDQHPGGIALVDRGRCILCERRFEGQQREACSSEKSCEMSTIHRIETPGREKRNDGCVFAKGGLRGHRHPSRPCGCGPPVRATARRSCRRRSVPCGRPR